MKKTTLIACAIFISFNSYGQVWLEELYKKNSSPKVKEKFEAFENYRKNHPYTKGNGYNPYAREMDFINKRVSGNNFFNPNSLYIEWKKEKNKARSQKKSLANWTSLGPINTPIILSSGKKRGNGRIMNIKR